MGGAGLCAGGGEAAPLDPGVGRQVKRGRRAEEAVEAVIQRRVAKLAGPVDVGGVVEVGGLFAVGGGDGHAQVPLAEHGGVVAMGLEERRDREAATLDERRGETAEHAAALARPPTVAARHQAVARGGAGGGSRVGRREADALRGQAVDVGGGDLAFGVVAGGATSAFTFSSLF